jgi:PAS domain S-box-containing protein
MPCWGVRRETALLSDRNHPPDFRPTVPRSDRSAGSASYIRSPSPGSWHSRTNCAASLYLHADRAGPSARRWPRHLVLDVCGVVTVHVVVLLAPLVPLGVAAPVGDGDEDNRRDPLLVDQVVEDRLVATGLARTVVARLGQMSAIVESSNDAIVGMGVDGRITTWNRGAQKLFGYAAEEIVGQPVSLLEPESAQGETQHTWAAEALEKVRAGRSADCHWEVARRRKDGSTIDVLLSVSPILDLGGTLGGVSLIARDITERKRAERALAERARLAALRADIGVALARSEELRSILQHCTEIVVEHLHVAFARVWTLNPSAQTLELQASAGLSTHLDGPDGRVPMGKLTIGRIAQTRRSLFTNDVTHDSHIGDHEWVKREGMVAFAGYPLVVSDRVVGVLAVFAREELPRSVVDDLGSLTYEIAQCVERKRAEEASQHYARELESANEELRELVAYRQRAEEQAREGVERRDRFLAILSHELRNPLAAVLNAANLLEAASEDGEVLRHAQGAIRRQSQQMARLLDDLLDVSRITRNRIDIRRQIIDVCDSSRDAVDAVRPMCDGRGHELHTDLPGEPPQRRGVLLRVVRVEVGAVLVDEFEHLIPVLLRLDENDAPLEQLSVFPDELIEEGEFGPRGLMHTGEGDPDIHLRHRLGRLPTGGLLFEDRLKRCPVCLVGNVLDGVVVERRQNAPADRNRDEQGARAPGAANDHHDHVAQRVPQRLAGRGPGVPAGTSPEVEGSRGRGGGVRDHQPR